MGASTQKQGISKFIHDNFTTILTLMFGVLSGKVFFDFIEYDRKTLTSYSIPLADTSLNLDNGTKLWGGKPNNNICSISGKYSIKNTGEFPWIIENTRIRIYNIPLVDAEDVRAAEQGYYSRTLANYLPRLTVLAEENIKNFEKVGPNGTFERKFHIYFEVPQGNLTDKYPHNFVVDLNASGGRINRFGNISRWKNHLFLGEELRHMELTSYQCLREKTG